MFSAPNWNTQSRCWKERRHRTSRFRAVHLMACRPQFPPAFPPNCGPGGPISPRWNVLLQPRTPGSASRRRRRCLIYRSRVSRASGEAQSTADGVTTAQQAETIALNRFRNGLVSYLDVIYAQTALLANQRTATQIVGQRMVATVVLVKALGGGWFGVPAPQGSATTNAPTPPAKGAGK